MLVYHQVTDDLIPSFRRYSLTVNEFSRQMAWLARSGYHTISPAQLANPAGAAALPARPIIITFDDGFTDAVRHAADVLARHQFSATFYLVAGLAGQVSEWTRTRRGFTAPLIDWRIARELERGGFTCGSHSMTHRRLAALDPRRCRDELVESRRTIEDALGHEVRDFAYPFGSVDARVRELTSEAGYTTAVTTTAGYASSDDDPLALPRFTVRGDHSFLDFVSMVRTGRRLRELRPPLALYRAASCVLAALLP
jgi:peptidoglycan/xylan/chitin deacetylase (PgdA/CDA1 family)